MSDHRSTDEVPSTSRPRIGVALSGGGMRGLAHLGVLQAMEEQDLQISALAGTSMGGLIAAAYASGRPISELAAFALKIRILDLASPDLSWRAFFDHRKMRALLSDLLGSDGLTFEDLDIPLAVTAVDLETGELVILDRGPLIPALMATAALPVVFAPVRHQERWLVDGGALNNLPVDVVRRLGADRVVGVAVAPVTGFDLEEDPEITRSRGLSLRGLLRFGDNTRDWRLPLLIAEASIGWTQQLINQTRMELCPPDLLIRVHLRDMGILSTDGSERAIETGYETAMNHRETLRTLMAPARPPWQRQWASFVRRLRLAWRILRQREGSLYPAP